MTENEQLPIRSNRCPIDNKSLKNDAVICEECARLIRSRLSEIPRLYVEAGAFLEPGRGGTGSSGSERTIGVNLAALGFRQASDLLGVLEAWVQFVVEERDLAPFKARGMVEDRVIDSCAFLLRHADWLAQNELAPDWFNEIALIHNEGLAATRQFMAKVTRIKCPTSLETFISEDEIGYENCGAWLTLGENPLDPIKCRRCDREWSTLRLITIILSTPDIEAWMDSEEIAKILQIKPRDVIDLVKEHHLRKKGKRGEWVYDLIAVNVARTKAVEG